MAGNRSLDPEAVNEFKHFIQALLDYTESELVEKLKQEPMNKAPAFGLFASGKTRAAEYEQSYNALWTDLQNMRGMYKAILNNLDETLEGHDVSEDINISEQNDFIAALEGEGSSSNTHDGPLPQQ